MLTTGHTVLVWCFVIVHKLCPLGFDYLNVVRTMPYIRNCLSSWNQPLMQHFPYTLLRRLALRRVSARVGVLV